MKLENLEKAELLRLKLKALYKELGLLKYWMKALDKDKELDEKEKFEGNIRVTISCDERYPSSTILSKGFVECPLPALSKKEFIEQTWNKLRDEIDVIESQIAEL